MFSIKSLFRKLLKIDELDEEDEATLDSDIKQYSEIINSSKYADSNSNTVALERLMNMLAIKGEPDGGPKVVEIPPAVHPTLNEVEKHHTNYKLESELTASFADVIVDETPSNDLAAVKFEDRLVSHMKLIDDIEEGEASVLPAPPISDRPKFQRFKLGLYSIPKYIYKCIEYKAEGQLGLLSPLQIDNYTKKFQTLLWVEEAHQSAEMRRYDITNTMLAKYDGNQFLLSVPGLAEGRPSLLRGDKVLLESKKRSTYYEGFINEVREHDVTVKLHQSINSLNGLMFDVRFLLSRTPFRRCHHGVDQYRELRATVFPIPSKRCVSPKIHIEQSEIPSSRFFNKTLNVYQRQAIACVLRGENRPAPYIIFGPPGTGKTVTLIEAILQVYKLLPSSRILVCANSNSSVDLCARRIKESGVVPLEKIVRLAAFYRIEKQLIPEDIEDITLDMDGLALVRYEDYRIVVTTCIQSGALYDYSQRFDYVFIDEAGHSSEPESMIALGLIRDDGCCVLAGDPHQLGPVCISDIASKNGLGTSLLERLARRTVYQRRIMNGKMSYDAKYITKLRISYRCDPRILEISSKLFYDGDLKCENETPEYWMKLFNLETPIVFHTVFGRDRREYLNPSWFNPNEAIRCLIYVKKLYDAGLRSHQLGIITPYRRQIEKLNLLFDSINLERCKIATMEEFQGEEREVIIISTVRTREKKLSLDKKFNLGFLFNPKRFNVALSRAKWLVIVIGDPAILSRDCCWKTYIERAHKFDEEPKKELVEP